jgi:hypothetical protein
MNRMVKLRKSLFLLGSFSIGHNIAMATHELGHALAMWATGGSVARITLNPFSKSYTVYGSPAAYPLFTSWAGAVFSSAIGLLLLICFRNSQRWWTLPLMMMGLCAIVVNGLYLIVDTVLLSGGDATYLIHNGIARSIILLVGIGLIILGLTIGYCLFPRMGLTSSDDALTRLAILEGGVGPYLIVMLIYQICQNGGKITEWLAYVIAGILMLACVALGSIFIERWWSFRQRHAVQIPTWSAVTVSLVAAAMLLAVEFLAFG